MTYFVVLYIDVCTRERSTNVLICTTLSQILRSSTFLQPTSAGSAKPMNEDRNLLIVLENPMLWVSRPAKAVSLHRISIRPLLGSYLGISWELFLGIPIPYLDTSDSGSVKAVTFPRYSICVFRRLYNACMSLFLRPVVSHIVQALPLTLIMHKNWTSKLTNMGKSKTTRLWENLDTSSKAKRIFQSKFAVFWFNLRSIILRIPATQMTTLYTLRGGNGQSLSSWCPSLVLVTL
ncbi:hypothetical protein B0O99DRAFT_113140 [Bisporella sp. PMI_857]|nr:hypothetical protein B0O99DRAFT_113140 [Bisporella sp. PMI_857]